MKKEKMGKLVMFWSPYAGHGKTTSSLCAVLGCFALQYPELELAVSHTQKSPSALLKKIDEAASDWEEKGWLGMYGADAIKLYVGQKGISSETVRRCGLPLSGKNIYFYPNYMRKDKEAPITDLSYAKYLKEEFDIVFMDVESGNPENALLCMREADYTVLVLPQDPLYVEMFWKEISEYEENIRYGIILSSCFAKSGYRSSYYKKKYGKKFGDKLLGEIMWSKEFFEAISYGKTFDFFSRNSLPLKQEENYEFIIQAKKTAENIRKQIFAS